MLVALLLIVIAGLGLALALMWLRLKKLEQLAVAPRSAAPVPPSIPAARPAPSPAEAAPLVDLSPVEQAGEYDPDATKVHIRPPLEANHAVLTDRKGAASASAAHLLGMSGPMKGQKFPIHTTGTTIGRSRTCHIILSDSRVSSHHAWIGVENGKMVLRDLESTNGTFLNTHTNESVREAALVSGDTIFFGSHQGDQFRFVLD